MGPFDKVAMTKVPSDPFPRLALTIGSLQFEVTKKSFLNNYYYIYYNCNILLVSWSLTKTWPNFKVLKESRTYKRPLAM
jgi:hypothetical protein